MGDRIFNQRGEGQSFLIYLELTLQTPHDQQEMLK